MVFVNGTNVGFVTEAPVADPEEGTVTADKTSFSYKDTSPAMNILVTEIGWWADPSNPGSAGDFEVAIYSDDGTGEPDGLIAKSSLTAKGTTGGWKSASVNIELSASTVYWMAFSLEDTTSFTWTNYDLGYGNGMAIHNNAPPPLPSDWGTSDYKDTSASAAIYAVYEEAPPPENINPKVKVSGTFSTKKTLVKIGGTFTEKPVLVKVSGTFQ